MRDRLLLDAFAESRAERAHCSRTRGPRLNRLVRGSLGFQYYWQRRDEAGRAGSVGSNPEISWCCRFIPSRKWFFRPHIGQVSPNRRLESREQVAEVAWDDAPRAQTILNYYGGIVPVMGRSSPIKSTFIVS